MYKLSQITANNWSLSEYKVEFTYVDMCIYLAYLVRTLFNLLVYIAFWGMVSEGGGAEVIQRP